MIKLSAGAGEEEHLALLHVLNSSTACFWLKQMGCGSSEPGEQDEGWEGGRELTGTQLEQFPLPVSLPIERSQRLNRLSADLAAVSPATLCERCTPTAMALTHAHAQWIQVRGRMISEQEELDWDVYHRYGILTDAEAEDVVLPDPAEAPGLASGERAFEIVLARKLAEGTVETDWFTRHGTTPITTIPEHWSQRYQEVVARRIELIERRHDLALIEHPECKRRWTTEPWEQQRERALREWLLDRMEARALWFAPTANGDQPASERTVRSLAEMLRGDNDFISVAALWASDSLDNPNADLAEILDALVDTEDPPFLTGRQSGSGSAPGPEHQHQDAAQSAMDRITQWISSDVTRPLLGIQKVLRGLEDEEPSAIAVRTGSTPGGSGPEQETPTQHSGSGSLDVPDERFVSPAPTAEPAPPAHLPPEEPGEPAPEEPADQEVPPRDTRPHTLDDEADSSDQPAPADQQSPPDQAADQQTPPDQQSPDLAESAPSADPPVPAPSTPAPVSSEPPVSVGLPRPAAPPISAEDPGDPLDLSRPAAEPRTWHPLLIGDSRTVRAPELDAALERFGRPEASGQIARSEEERLQVIAEFPVDAWPELPLERYAMGTDAAETPFCTILEYHTPHLGSIRGGSTRKHIIYRTNTGSWWLAGPLENLHPGEAWRQLRREFVVALRAVRAGDFGELDGLQLLRWGQALVTKTLAIYAPEAYLRVYSGEHIRHFIRLFGGTPLPGVPSWELNRQLKKLIEDDPLVGEWDPEEVLQFLYTYLDPRTNSDQILKITPGENARLWDECLRDGVIRVGFDTGDLRQYVGVDGLVNRLRAVDPSRKEPHLRSLARRLLRFRDLEPGTRIVANRGRSEILAVGTVTEDGYHYASELPEYRNVLGVDWDTSYAQRLDSPARGWLSTFGNVSSSLWKTIEQGRARNHQGWPSAPPEAPLPSDVLQVLGALERKGQVILHGPPGTGKTRLALNSALALMGHRGALEGDPAERAAALRELVATADTGALGDAVPPVTLITFHPSLGYEDFVEGYKPQPGGAGTLSLRCTDGLFFELCSAAERDPDRTFLLVVDEINRADLPRVLGELVTLLELDKRDMEVRLPVSGRSFRVPRNIRIIGTMNTADRSVAHLDAAIRRRFGFLAVPPEPALVETTVGALDVAAFLTELNRRISVYLDRDRQVGHAFLLHDDAPLESTEQFSAAFYHDIVPLLEDYALGDSDLLTRLLGAELVDPTAAQIVPLDPDDLAVTLAKEFDAGVDADADQV